MVSLAGRWLTTFGPMELRQDDTRLDGTYWYQGIPSKIEGKIQAGRFNFRYQDASEHGEGWFAQTRFGQFHGQYRPDGAGEWRAWNGERAWEGIWQTTYGRMRLIQEEGRVYGYYGGVGAARIDGHLEGQRLVFRYQEPSVEGEGWFELAEDCQSFSGAWHPDGSTSVGPWTGQRIRPTLGLTWLIVMEASWQGSLAEPEYSYGNMLKEFFARLPHVAVRHRFFNDEASLARWCQELMYIPEPAIVLISSHGTTEGVTVHGQTINPKVVINSLRNANNIQLLHFATCLVLQEDKAGDFARRIDTDVPFPISGYTTSVDWGGSAVSEFSYLDMILSKRMTPEEAARRLPALIAYAGDQAPEESPYAAVGFRFLKPGQGAARP